MNRPAGPRSARRNRTLPGLPAAALAACLAAAAPTAAAGSAQRVADVNPGPATGGTEHFFLEADFEPYGGRVYFTVDDGVHGNELWSTDGTLAGTALLADLCPGICSANPIELEAAGGLLFFAAADGAHGSEPWVTDGTAAGTRMVVDLVPGLGSSNPSGMTVLGGRVVFAANAPGRPRTLWSSDGTAAGTVPLGGTDPATTPAGPIPLAMVGGRLVFGASDTVHGFEPWSTDGTPGGTVPIGDLNPGTAGSVFSQPPFPGFEVFAVLGGAMLFAADDGTAGTELWSTDGTPGSAVLVADLDPGPSSGSPASLETCLGKVFFRADDGVHGRELWASDGTPGGTAMVADAVPGPEGTFPQEPSCAGDRLVYGASDAAHGREPWTSDGTPAGTGRIVDLRPGPDSGIYFMGHLAALGDRVAFFADDGATGVEPWITDGTAAGTLPLADISPGPDWSANPFAIPGADRREVVGGEWYFRAHTPATGFEVWVSDGSPAGTRMLETNLQSSAFWVVSHNAGTALMTSDAFAEHQGSLVFAADDGSHGLEPWGSDGTEAGTLLLGDLLPGPEGSWPSGIRSAENGAILVASAEPCCDRQGWVTDGTPGGTVPLLGPGELPVAEVAARLGGAVFFAGDDGLWTSDGTEQGTARLADADREGGVVRQGDWVYFAGGSDDPTVSELWRTDGASVEQVADVVPGPGGSRPRALAAGDKFLFFSADDGVAGREPWITDGTAAGTERVRDVRPGPGSGIPATFFFEPFGQVSAVGAGSRAFFLADDGAAGEELWVTDGTEAGTFLLRDVFPGARSAEVLWLTALGGRAFFVAEDGVHGRELWTSDGTPGGTVLVADLAPGPGSSRPEQLAAAGGRLYFTAHTPEHGRELWRTDGTAGGTERVTDLAPGPLPSSPLSLTVAGDSLWFAATDGVTGFEPYRLPLPGTIFADGFESGDTSLWTATAQ